MRLRYALIFAALLLTLAILAQPVSAFENEDAVPAAFVEGTRDFTIPYLEKMRAQLREHFDVGKLVLLDDVIALVKAENAALLRKIASLRANQNFLKEKDEELMHYRETLALATDLMFDLLQKLNERTALPSR